MHEDTRYRYSRLKETFRNTTGETFVTIFINIRKIVVQKIDNEILSEKIYLGPSFHMEKPIDEMPLPIQELPDVEVRYYIDAEEYTRLEVLFKDDSQELINYEGHNF